MGHHHASHGPWLWMKDTVQVENDLIETQGNNLHKGGGLELLRVSFSQVR